MSKPRRISAEEREVLVRAVEAGHVDVPMTAFFKADCGTREEAAFEREVDAMFSRLLGRQVKVWTLVAPGLTLDEEKVWRALFDRETLLNPEDV